MAAQTEYTVEEMRTLLKNMSGMYDLARVVDPIECRILNFHSDGTISMKESCYGIWNAGQKCNNCSSSAACRTGCHQEKSEHFKDDTYHIQSNPVRLKLPDGGTYDAVVELVNIKSDKNNTEEANDRAAENMDHKAAEYQAIHDNLTHVLNEGAFYELARDLIVNEPDKQWVMVTGNVMNFRLVNTLFGVQKGNEVLVKTADSLRKIAEKADGLCGRLGGDQFAILIPEEAFSEEELTGAERGLSKEFNCGIYTFIIHFGIYRVTDASIPISVMCGRANAALYTIRDNQKDIVAYFDDEMLKKILFQQEVLGSFAKAIEDREFKMYLQPLVEADGKVFGAEALIRWIRPDGSMIMPGAFIELLEQADLIHELDIYIWECAVDQLSRWKNTDLKDLTISVNMSAKDFFSVDVYDVLTKLVEKYQIDESSLRLEITETALLEEPESSSKIVDKLRARGFIVEIDDFGKGYSSLSMLKDIEADVLKIDMGLLQEIESKSRSKIILGAIINMANSLGMDVITEGVETETELKVLTEMGCRHFQGYYFSKPIPVSEFEKSLNMGLKWYL